MLGSNIIASWNHLLFSCLFYHFCLFKFNFFLSSYFYSTPSSLAYKLGISQCKYKQCLCRLDTRSSVLIFTTYDKIGTVANLLTDMHRRWWRPRPRQRRSRSDQRTNNLKKVVHSSPNLIEERNGGSTGTVTCEGHEGEDGGHGAPPPTSRSFQKEPIVLQNIQVTFTLRWSWKWWQGMSRSRSRRSRIGRSSFCTHRRPQNNILSPTLAFHFTISLLVKCFFH